MNNYLNPNNNETPYQIHLRHPLGGSCRCLVPVLQKTGTHQAKS